MTAVMTTTAARKEETVAIAKEATVEVAHLPTLAIRGKPHQGVRYTLQAQGAARAIIHSLRANQDSRYTQPLRDCPKSNNKN